MKLSVIGCEKGKTVTIGANDTKALWDDSQYKSLKRCTKLATNDFVNGTISATEFKHECFEMAGEIGKTAFGIRFLASIIGKALQLNPGQYLGFHWSFLSWPKGSYYAAVKWKNMHWNRLSSLRKTIHVIQAAYQDTKTKGGSQEAGDSIRLLARKVNMQTMLPLVLETAWAYNEQDLANTLHGACWRLFFDSDATSNERLKRAEAVQIRGNDFVRLSKSVANAKTCE